MFLIQITSGPIKRHFHMSSGGPFQNSDAIWDGRPIVVWIPMAA